LVLAEIFKLLLVNIRELLYNGFFSVHKPVKLLGKTGIISPSLNLEKPILKGKVTCSKSWKGSVTNHAFWLYIVDDESTIYSKI